MAVERMILVVYQNIQKGIFSNHILLMEIVIVLIDININQKPLQPFVRNVRIIYRTINDVYRHHHHRRHHSTTKET